MKIGQEFTKKHFFHLRLIIPASVQDNLTWDMEKVSYTHISQRIGLYIDAKAFQKLQGAVYLDPLIISEKHPQMEN